MSVSVCVLFLCVMLLVCCGAFGAVVCCLVLCVAGELVCGVCVCRRCRCCMCMKTFIATLTSALPIKGKRLLDSLSVRIQIVRPHGLSIFVMLTKFTFTVRIQTVGARPCVLDNMLDSHQQYKYSNYCTHLARLHARNFYRACDSRSDETQEFGLQHFCARHLETIITQLACHVQYTTWSTFHGTCREHLDFLLPTVPFNLDTICYSAVWSICRTIPFHKYKLRNAWPIAVSGGVGRRVVGGGGKWWWTWRGDGGSSDAKEVQHVRVGGGKLRVVCEVNGCGWKYNGCGVLKNKCMTHSRADLLNDENAVKYASSFWPRA